MNINPYEPPVVQSGQTFATDERARVSWKLIILFVLLEYVVSIVFFAGLGVVFGLGMGMAIASGYKPEPELFQSIYVSIAVQIISTLPTLVCGYVLTMKAKSQYFLHGCLFATINFLISMVMMLFSWGDLQFWYSIGFTLAIFLATVAVAWVANYFRSKKSTIPIAVE